jgi:isoleucyl-tRNA synthetase
VSDADLLPLDRYMLAKTRELVEKVSGADGHGGWYGEFQFHRAYQAINEFCIVDLSAFYLDVLKDRLYTFAPQSLERRSAQTVLWRIAEALVRLVAPILTFTSDEVWQYLPALSDRPASVHLAHFPKAEHVGAADPSLLEDWRRLLLIRDEVLVALEAQRKAGNIGKALESSVRVEALPAGEAWRLLKKYRAGLKELFNVSQVTIDDRAGLQVGAVPMGNFNLLNEKLINPVVEGAAGTKCNRCWNYYPDNDHWHVRPVTPKIPATDAPWSVCGRCENALAQMGYVEASR